MSNNSCKDVEYVFDTPFNKWNSPKPGICLQGKCQNKKCNAFDSIVNHNVGFGVYCFGGYGISCPICNTNINPSICWLNDCKWKYLTQQSKENPFVSKWIDTKNKFVKFDKSSNNNYLVLMVIANES